MKNVIIGNFFQDSKLKHIVIFVHKSFFRFRGFLYWIHFPRIDTKTLWNRNCDFLVGDGWKLRDLNHTISNISISYKNIELIIYGVVSKNLRWTPLIEFLKHRLTFFRSQMFVFFPLQPVALKYNSEFRRLFQRIKKSIMIFTQSECLIPKTNLGTLKIFCSLFKNPPCAICWTVCFTIDLLKSKTMKILHHWEWATSNGFQPIKFEIEPING